MQLFRKLIKAFFGLIFLIVLCTFLFSEGPKLLLGTNALVIYHYLLENKSGENVTCAVIGWYPKSSEHSVLWCPAPSTQGSFYNKSLKHGEKTEIALTTSDFCGMQVLVRRENATETKSVSKMNNGFGFVILPLSELPLASEALLPCFSGGSVTLPAR